MVGWWIGWVGEVAEIWDNYMTAQNFKIKTKFYDC